VTCHPREKNYGHRTPPGPCVPHGGTPEAPNRRRRVVAPGAHQYPLTPSGWHALRAGVWHRRRRVVVVAVSCRHVVAPVEEEMEGESSEDVEKGVLCDSHTNRKFPWFCGDLRFPAHVEPHWPELCSSRSFYYRTKPTSRTPVCMSPDMTRFTHLVSTHVEAVDVCTRL
jgi:hypothetical protein